MSLLSRREALAIAAAPMLAAQHPPRLPVRSSRQISSSRISIGFETLDRMMFDPERTWEWIGQTGVKWARCQTGWGRTEKERGVYDFAWLDRVVNRLLDLGIQPWFNLGYGNRLYTPEAPHFSAVGWAPVFQPAALEAWKRYVAALGERFRGRVRHVEIWNEPNIPQYWQPSPPNASEYVRLVRETAPVLRRTMPDVTLIGGAVAGLGENFDYIDQMLEAGLGALVDRLSYHPYRARPEANYADEIRVLRGLLSHHGAKLPLWQGENGAPSEPNGFGALRDLNWTEETQAKWLLRRLLTDLALEIDLTSYFLIVDLANYVAAKGLDGRTNFKGVLRASDYRPKKSFYALQNLCALFDGETVKANHLLRFSDVKGAPETSIEQACFSRKGAPLCCYWSSSQLPDESVDGSARIYAWPGDGAAWASPVLIDLLSGEIRKPERVARAGSAVILAAAPLRDAPVAITEARAL